MKMFWPKMVGLRRLNVTEMEVGVGVELGAEGEGEVGEGQEEEGGLVAGMYVPVSEEGEHLGGIERELLLLLGDSSQDAGTLPARRSVALRKEA